MKNKILISEKSFVKILKSILSEENLTFSEILRRIKTQEKNEKLKNLEGKTVTFDEYNTKGKKLDTNSYKIMRAEYNISDGGKKIIANIILNCEKLNTYKTIFDKGGNNIFVNMINGNISFTKYDENINKIILKNVNLENYIKSISNDFPMYVKEKERIKTDF